uniref:C2 domain-containing protein n=1 Tax=Gouania willdenowi TaxID=441366 RepID=A0A8C5H4L2_GOUWI
VRTEPSLGPSPDRGPKLKVDLLDIRRKGAKRSSEKYSPRSCGRCQQPLSALTLFPTQCKMCKHRVCRTCREVLIDGSWVCSVCAKELDLKKMTSDWFYDQRVNRFSSAPGHDIISEAHISSSARNVNSAQLQSQQGFFHTLGSMASIYSDAGDFDSVDVSGDIVFSLSYDEQTKSLHVFIKECYNLAYGDSARQLCNPYVKCYLMPDKSRQSKRKTSIKRRTTNPVYNETLKYPISRSKLFTRSLLISVWHYGRLSRNAFLGEVDIGLDSRDLDSPYEDRVPAPTGLTTAFAQYKGELVISLKYIPVKKPAAENVKGKYICKLSISTFCHVDKLLNAWSFCRYLFPTKAKSTKRKTSIVKKNLNPHYNHIFVYKDLTLEQLKEMCLELTVWDKEAMTSNEFLGGLRLSCGEGMIRIGKEEVEMDSVGEEVDLWEKMMQYPDSWAEGTLPLRSTMGKSKGK